MTFAFYHWSKKISCVITVFATNNNNKKKKKENAECARRHFESGQFRLSEQYEQLEMTETENMLIIWIKVVLKVHLKWLQVY